LSRLSNPPAGVDEYLLTWYPAVINYLKERTGSHFDMETDHYMEILKQ